MAQKNIILIPHFEHGAGIGQAVLNTYAAHADAMTEHLQVMRREGCKGVTLADIYERYVEEHPEAYTKIKFELFTFTGKRVIVNEKRFFQWYATTREGLEYKARVEMIAPSLFGKFSKITM